MRSFSAYPNRDGVADFRQSIVRHARQQSMHANIEVDVTGAAQALDQHDAARDNVFSCGRGSTGAGSDVEILGPNAQNRLT